MHLSESYGAWFNIITFNTVIMFKIGKIEKLVMEYKPGDYFGELALLSDAPRAASIKAKVCY